jgi:ATP-dependent 26S proteasome regulatory subunit
MPWSNEIDLEYLVNQTDGANAASLVALCQAAAIDALRSRPAQAVSLFFFFSLFLSQFFT